MQRAQESYSCAAHASSRRAFPKTLAEQLAREHFFADFKVAGDF